MRMQAIPKSHVLKKKKKKDYWISPRLYFKTWANPNRAYKHKQTEELLFLYCLVITKIFFLSFLPTNYFHYFFSFITNNTTSPVVSLCRHLTTKFGECWRVIVRWPNYAKINFPFTYHKFFFEKKFNLRGHYWIWWSPRERQKANKGFAFFLLKCVNEIETSSYYYFCCGKSIIFISFNATREKKKSFFYCSKVLIWNRNHTCP